MKTLMTPGVIEIQRRMNFIATEQMEMMATKPAADWIGYRSRVTRWDRIRIWFKGRAAPCLYWAR